MFLQTAEVQSNMSTAIPSHDSKIVKINKTIAVLVNSNGERKNILSLYVMFVFHWLCVNYILVLSTVS